MLYKLLVYLIGSILFLFIFWRKLKEDYSSSLVFSSGFLVIFGIFIPGAIAFFFFKVWWFWFGVAGIVSALIFSVLKLKLKLFELVDALVAGLFPLLLFIFLLDSVETHNIFSLGGFFIILAIYMFYKFIDAHYKGYVWYGSGKVGFSSLLAIFMLFLLRSISGFFTSSMLSYSGNLDIIFSGIFSAVSFLGIVHLVRKS